jgi:hypothetical protein
MREGSTEFVRFEIIMGDIVTSLVHQERND